MVFEFLGFDEHLLAATISGRKERLPETREPE